MPMKLLAFALGLGNDVRVLSLAEDVVEAIEPLEASALALVELSAAMLRDQMPATRASMDIVARRFNETFRGACGCTICDTRSAAGSRTRTSSA